MAILTVQKIVPGGLEPAALAAAAGGGDSFQNTGNEFVEINNGDVSDKTVTVEAQQNCNFGVDSNDHNHAVVVTAGERRLIGPFPTDKYNDANGRVQLTYSAVTSVTVGVYTLPR
jgi:hypothetical protein